MAINMMNSLTSDKGTTNTSFLVKLLSIKQKMSYFQRVLSKLKNPIFGLFFSLSTTKNKFKNSFGTQKLKILLGNAIFTLQMMSFLWYEDYGMKDWESYSAFWVALRTVNFDVLVVYLSSAYFWISFSLWLTFSTTVGLGIIGLLVHFKKSVPTIFKFVLTKALEFIAGVGFIPAVSFSVVGLSHSVTKRVDISEYTTFDFELKEYHGLLLAVNLVLVLGLYTCFHTFTSEMRHSLAQQDLTAVSTSKYRVREGLLVVGISGSKLLLLEERPYLHLNLVAVVALYTAVQYLQNLPYYSPFTNCVRCAGFLVFGLEALVFVVSYLQDNAFLTVLLTCFVVPLCLVPLKTLFEHRYSSIEASIQSKFHKAESLETFELYMRKHLINNPAEQRSELIGVFGRCFDKASFRHKKKLYVWETNLCLYALKNERLARLKVWKCIGKESNLETEYQEFCCRQAFGKKTFEDLEYIKYLWKLSKVTERDNALCHQLINFWSELTSSHPKIQVLRNLSKSIDKLIRKIQKTAEKLIEQNKSNPEICNIYGSFLNDILFDNEKALRLTRLAELISSYNSANNKYSSKLKFFDKDNGLLLISADPENLGVVIYANTKAASILGTSVDTMLGSDFKSLIPPPYDSFHNQVLERFLLYSEQPKLRFPENFAILNQQGYLVEITMYSKAISLESYPILSFLFREMNPDREVAIVSEEGIINSHSENFPRQLGYQTDVQGLNIYNMFPDFESILDPNKAHFLRVNGKKLAIISKEVPVGSSGMKFVWIISEKEEVKALSKIDVLESVDMNPKEARFESRNALCVFYGFD